MNVNTILAFGYAGLLAVLAFATGDAVFIWSSTFFVGLGLGRVTRR